MILRFISKHHPIEREREKERKRLARNIPINLDCIIGLSLNPRSELSSSHPRLIGWGGSEWEAGSFSSPPLSLSLSLSLSLALALERMKGEKKESEIRF